MDRAEEQAVAAPTLVACTRAHRTELACLDLAESRALLATGGGDGELRLWEWRAGAGWLQAGRAARAHRFGVSAARWAAAGALLATGGVDGAARLWAAGGEQAPRCVATLAWPGACSLRALCWVGGGALATGHDDGAVLVWGAATGAVLARMAGGAAHGGAVHALAAPAGGALLLSGCTEGTLKVFYLAELVSSGGGVGGVVPAPVGCQHDAHDMGVLCAAAAGQHVATGGQDARVRTWRCGRARALAPRAVLEGHAGAVTALRWARGGTVLASASLDRTARLWAPRAGVCLHALPAHDRYLTCAALARGASLLITGSNDRTFRTWSLGALSLDAELRPPCDALAHFALGDLEGIELLKMEEEQSSRAAEEEADEEGGTGEARCVWQLQAHAGAINCIAARGDLLTTASSDGSVKVWRWAGSSAAEADGTGGEEVFALYLEHTLAAHRYPVLAAEFGASGAGAVLLSAGLDGDALLWDVETGVQVRALSVPGGCGGGGGGVRGARLSRERPPRALLATDDGLAPLWSTAQADPRPERVYAGLSEAATCCAWAEDAAVCAVGGAGGELLLLVPPGDKPALTHTQAHDLGVTSCDFAPSALAPEGGYLLATVGNDSLIKLWEISLSEEEARCTLAHVAEAHGGCAYSVRWGARGVLASAGDDGWVRAWRLERGGGTPRLVAMGGVHCAGGCVAALAVRGGLLCSGGARGVLALWRVCAGDRGEEGERGARLWRAGGVERWLREHVCGARGGVVSARRGAALLAAARGLTGAALLDEPLEEVLATLGFGSERMSAGSEEEEEEWASVRTLLAEELHWLRRAPPSTALEARAAHALLCPLSHRLLRWPTRAADGFTYERENILEWLLAASPEGAVSPMSGCRLRNLQLMPNYRLLDTVRAFVREGEEQEEEEGMEDQEEEKEEEEEALCPT